MPVYSVYIPPEVAEPSQMVEQDLARVMFLPDGKSIFALIAPPIWLIWHRLWLPLAVYALYSVAVAAISYQVNPALGSLLSILPGLYLLLEGAELLRARYEREHWQYAGIVDGNNKEAAELRYFSSLDLPVRTPQKPVAETPPPAPKPSKAWDSGRRLAPQGLFPE